MKLFFSLVLVFCLSYIYAQDAYKADTVKIDEKYTWNLKDIYASDSMWEEDFKWLEENIEAYLTFKNKLSSQLYLIYDFIKFDEIIKMKIDKLTMYAYLLRDINLSDARYTNMYRRIATLESQAKSNKSFFENELIKIPFDELGDYITSEPKMEPYDQYIYSIIRNNAHSLQDVKEEVVTLTKPLTQVAFNSFINIANLDFNTMYDDLQDTIGFREHKNAMAALFEGNITINKFYARIRNFNSSLEANLFPEDIPLDVYDNLINTVNRNLTPAQRWIKVKCKLLNKSQLSYDELFDYSIYPEIDKKYSYEEGVTILQNSIKLLGPEYNSIADTAINNRWIDVYPNNNKRQDQYTGYILGAHPYVLLNWRGLFENLYALQHEMGHVVNVELSRNSQPLIYSQIPNFSAEVPSKVNELLLLEYLNQQTISKKEKLFFLEKYIVQIISSLYLQTLLAEFEKRVYELSEKGSPLTYDVLERESTYLFRTYFGEQFLINNKVRHLWAMVPHYYYNFYIYSYPMGLSIAYKFVSNIKEKGSPAVEEYMTFLKSGGFDYPNNTLLRCGVQINSEETILPLIAKLNLLINEFELLSKTK